MTHSGSSFQPPGKLMVFKHKTLNQTYPKLTRISIPDINSPQELNASRKRTYLSPSNSTSHSGLKVVFLSLALEEWECHMKIPVYLRCKWSKYHEIYRKDGKNMAMKRAIKSVSWTLSTWWNKIPVKHHWQHQWRSNDIESLELFACKACMHLRSMTSFSPLPVSSLHILTVTTA